MPAVGGRKFPYTSKGKTAAKKYAKRTGRPVTRPKKTAR
jgi:hypothetical protein